MVYHLTNCTSQLLSLYCLPENTESTILQSDCGDGDLKLVEGPSANEGKIEICMNGFWGTVCRGPGTFNVEDARVVCRQLGFQAYGMVSSYLVFISYIALF